MVDSFQRLSVTSDGAEVVFWRSRTWAREKEIAGGERVRGRE